MNKSKKNYMKGKKGITLIALVVTIIILIILAGISINLVLGENGIIQKAKQTKVAQTEAEVKEKVEIILAEYAMEREFNNKTLLVFLKEKKANNEIDEVTDNEDGTYIIEINEYEIIIQESNLSIIDVGKAQGEKPTIQAEIITEGMVAEGGEVQIKVTASINEGTITGIEATNGAVLKTDKSATEKVFAVNANGTYYFKATADNRRSSIIKVEVNTLIEKPIIEIKNIEKTSFTIAVTNNYAEGLITEYKYYVEGSVKKEGTTDKECEVTELAEGTEYNNIYVEAYIGEIRLTSEVTTVTTKSSWEEIAKIAKAISDNDKTITSETETVTITVDEKEYTLSVGDTMTVKVDGIEKTVRIMGFNHDTLTDTAAYGGKNTYAGISFEFVDSIMTEKPNSASTNANGWKECELRSTLNETTINSLSNSKFIKEVEKSYIQSGTTVSTCSDKLWLLSCSEIWDNGRWGYVYGAALAKEGEQYKYYKNIDGDATTGSTQVSKGGASYLRSPMAESTSSWCIVYTDGAANNESRLKAGISPGFCI